MNLKAPTNHTHHRDEAKSLLASVTNFDGKVSDSTEATNTIAAANAHASLAQADAVDQLTAAISALRFPALEVKKCLSGLGFSVRPKS